MTSKTTNKFAPEVRARAVRMVLDHEGEHNSRWAAISSIAGKTGCTPQTLNRWIVKAERDSGKRPGMPSYVAAKMKAMVREIRELRQANEILRKASARLDQVYRAPGGSWRLAAVALDSVAGRGQVAAPAGQEAFKPLLRKIS